MAYNNGFPITYPVYAPQYVQPQATQAAQAQQNNSITWVQGEAGAKSYLVAPNTTVQLWDSEAQTIYLKSADASGMPSMKILDYTIRDTSQAQVPAVTAPMQEYVTKEEFSAFAEKIEKRLNRGNDNKHREGNNNGKSDL